MIRGPTSLGSARVRPQVASLGRPGANSSAGPGSRSTRAASRKLEPPPRTQLHPVDEIGLVNDLAHGCRPSAPDYNVVAAPVAGSFGVVAVDVELVEPGVAESVNESTWS